MVEGLENGQTERRNTALRGVKIYDIMSCRIPACMIQVCIRKVLSVFFLLDFEVMIRVFKYTGPAERFSKWGGTVAEYFFFGGGRNLCEGA